MSYKIIEGTIYKVKLSNGVFRFFQFVGKDKSSLNADVIAIFKTRVYDEQISAERIVEGGIEGFAHTSVLAGLKACLWERALVYSIDLDCEIVFRSSNDYGQFPRMQIVSTNWTVWRMNEERVYVGVLPEKYYRADIGLIIAPANIVKWLETGEFPNKYYPKFK